MGKEDFSPERRKFLRNSLEASAAVALAPLEKVTRFFENGEQDPEQKRIKDCIAEYNKKHPEIKDKIEEQKKWFLRYMDSELYKNLLTKEMERVLQISAQSTKEEKEILRKFVKDELEDRKLKVKNVKFFINHTIENNTVAYTTVLNISDVSNAEGIEYLGKIDDLPKENDFLGITVNEIPFNLMSLDNFEAITVFCHEMHHISLTEVARTSTEPIEKTDLLFKQSLLPTSLDSTKIESGKEAYVLDTAENMARIIAVRKTLFQLGKMKSFKEEFNEKHIEYVKKYLDDLFPKSPYVRYLFNGEFKKENKEIDNETLLKLMNSFSGVSNTADPNTRLS